MGFLNAILKPLGFGKSETKKYPVYEHHNVIKQEEPVQVEERTDKLCKTCFHFGEVTCMHKYTKAKHKGYKECYESAK